MTVSVVFAIAGVIALLFGVIGGGIRAKEIEIPLLPSSARIVTVIVGLALLGITVWLESNKTLADNPASNPQAQPVSVVETPLVNPASDDSSALSTTTSTSPTQNTESDEAERLYSSLGEAKTWELVLQEPFDNNDNNWGLWNIDDEMNTQNIQIDRGVFSWELSIKQPNQYYLEIAPVTSLSDFYFSVKTKRVGQPTADQVNQAIWGIIFRRQGDKYYSFVINDLQEYSLWFHDSTGWTELVGNTISSLVNKEFSNELTVIADQNEITFFINGVPIKSITDSNLSEGNIGLYAGLNYVDDKVTFEFDDLEIRQKP